MASDCIDNQFNNLKKLADDRFAPLSEAESKMLRAAIAGDVAWCGPSQKNDDPHNDPSSQEGWGPEREIRADVLRWFCIDKEAEGYVDPQGIRVHAATVSGLLDLSYASVRFPLALGHCRVTNDIFLRLARLHALSLEGSCVRSIHAESVTVDGYLSLANGFIANGSVQLSDAQIAGVFACNHGTFLNPARERVQESAVALVADRATVKGSVHLRGAHVEGLVRLVGAKIDGNLSCGGGTFKNPAQKDLSESGIALLADCITVTAGVFFNDGFNAEGLVRLVGAHIERTLDCQSGTFKNAKQEHVPASGSALLLDGSLVKGDILFRTGFSADGSVFMGGVHIEGSLDCHGGIFTNLEPAVTRTSGGALRADGLFVQGSAFLGDGFQAKGLVGLVGAQIGLNLDFDGSMLGRVDAQRAAIKGALFLRHVTRTPDDVLNLRDAFVGSLADDRQSWPSKLALDGFVYGRIASGPRDSQSRLEWLSRQAPFAPQPYRQLAKFLREDGDDSGARRVLYEMEKRKHQDGQHGRLARLWNLIFRGTIGYGIYPRRALWWLLVLIVMGWGVYWGGYFRGAITPTNKEAYEAFHSKGGPPPNYPHFSALVYSAEHCFPLVNLGQKEAWTPDPNRLGLARFLRVFRWLQIFLGWALATFFVAGVTGIARKD